MSSGHTGGKGKKDLPQTPGGSGLDIPLGTGGHDGAPRWPYLGVFSPQRSPRSFRGRGDVEELGPSRHVPPSRWLKSLPPREPPMRTRPTPGAMDGRLVTQHEREARVRFNSTSSRRHQRFVEAVLAVQASGHQGRAGRKRDPPSSSRGRRTPWVGCQPRWRGVPLVGTGGQGRGRITGPMTNEREASMTRR
jgi:hypothetical protein